MSILNLFSRLSKKQGVLVTAAFIIVLGTIDYFTIPEIASSILYLVPVAFASWYLGKRTGFLVSAVCIIVGVTVNVKWTSLYPYYNWITLWNTLADLVTFTLVTYLVSELRKTLDEEKNLARTDYLTTLNNSRHFYSLVGAEIQRSRRYGHSFSIAYLDIDNFKVMNDNFGHQTGDEVLVQVAETIKEHIRNTDIPGRLGGDEFAVFLPETDFKETNAVMRRLQDGLRNLSAERSWPATVSIGVASFERQTDSVDDIINLADNLMYSVKENGKNNIRHELYK